MCGIFGTTNPQVDLIFLIRDNMERGAQAVSLFTPTTRIVYDNPDKGLWVPLDEPWALGHCQAPTGEPSPDRHPFQYKDWFVAHNGVIHGVEATIYSSPHFTDSAVIPYLAHMLRIDGWDFLNELDGTFACWAHNTKEKQTYLLSWVNPIYVSSTKFSSKPFEGGVLLHEGEVITWPNLRRVAEFQGRSHPYKPVKVSSDPSSHTPS